MGRPPRPGAGYPDGHDRAGDPHVAHRFVLSRVAGRAPPAGRAGPLGDGHQLPVGCVDSAGGETGRALGRGEPVHLPGLAHGHGVGRADRGVPDPPSEDAPSTFCWADALAVKVREAGRVVHGHVLLLVGIDHDGHREVLGMEVASAENVPAGWRSAEAWRPAACPGCSW
ncbi:hypothetical protein C3Y87_20850 [Carbonactinospora thermoautotrophica]|nr:hypothetical protein [Carbonactinospora thermoautotrophica]